MGDKFVNEVYHALPSLNAEARKTNENPPYMYDFYNVRCFTSNPASLTTSVAAWLVNCLIKALNENDVLPRIIMVIPDWDFLQSLEQVSFGILVVADAAITWMIDNMVKAVELKKDLLFQEKTGALMPGEPKFVWLKMIKRLRGYNKVLAVRNKFNWALEHALTKKKYHYIIDANGCITDSELFTYSNELKGAGRIAFWKEVDQCISMFDDKQLTCIPEANPEKSDNRNCSVTATKFKLPPVPSTKGYKKGHWFKSDIGFCS